MAIGDDIRGVGRGAGRGPARGLPRRRGAIFVTALGIIVVLTGLVLVFAREMRTEALAAKNRTSGVQASMVEQGAEQWVLAQIDAAPPGDAVTITQIATQQIQVGDGYFWILRADPTQDQVYSYGIADESGKVNLNAATNAVLLMLPNMTNDLADSIIDWRDADSNAQPNGAESDEYENQFGYDAKNSNFETVEELLLVKGATLQVLFGSDLNRDGVIDANEQAASGGALAAGFGGTSSDTRGLFNYVSVYNTEPNTDANGKARINLNDASTRNALTKYLQTQLSKSVADAIIAKMGPATVTTPGKGGKGGRTTAAPARYNNVFDFLVKTSVPKDSYGKIIDGLTTTRKKNRAGLINVATAPLQVLMTLPGIEQQDASELIAKRDGADTTNLGWVMTALSPAKAVGIGGSITSRSFQYSADIVAVSGDGRSFKRARIVVDASKLPAKIVYRKDLTSAGWPLDPGIRDQLRAGSPLVPMSGTTMGF